MAMFILNYLFKKRTPYKIINRFSFSHCRSIQETQFIQWKKKQNKVGYSDHVSLHKIS